MLEASHHYFQKAAAALGLSEKIRDILLTPRRVVKVEVVTESDAGELLIDGADRTYVAERHLQDDDSGDPIDHPELHEYFDERVGDTYRRARTMN